MSQSRRRLLQTTLAGSAGFIVAPSFFPESFLLGQGASANRRIQMAQIECGRMGAEDMLGTMKHTDLCRIVAVCDLDSRRAARDWSPAATPERRNRPRPTRCAGARRDRRPTTSTP
jgi:hypothetical protein